MKNGGNCFPLSSSRIREMAVVNITVFQERGKGQEEESETKNHCLGSSVTRGKIKG